MTQSRAKVALSGCFLLLLAVVLAWVVRWAIVDQPGRVINLPPPPAAVGNPPALAVDVSKPTIRGTVLNALTHQPVEQFTARVGHAYLENDLTVKFEDAARHFSNGLYRVTSQNSGRLNWYVRIEAPGYLPAISPPVSQSFTADFQLTPAPDLHGHILAPDGSPVRDATVVTALPRDFVYLISGRLRDDTSFTHTTTRFDGSYDLPPQAGKFAVAAFSDAGYAVADQDALAAGTDIRLAAWGVVKGRLLIGTRPLNGKRVDIFPEDSIQDPSRPTPTFIHLLQTRTDAQGQFTFDRVPPGQFQFGRRNIQFFGEAQTGDLWPSQTATVAPGQTVTLNLGGVGRSVVGRFVYPPIRDLGEAKIWITATVAAGATHPEPAQMPDDIRNGPLNDRLLWTRDFWETPAGETYLAQHPSNVMDVDHDGKFQIYDVLPGDYWIDVAFSGAAPRPPALSVPFRMPPIPDGVSDEPLVLADIPVKAK